MEDSRRVNISQQDQISTLEKERKLLIDVAYKAIATGEELGREHPTVALRKEILDKMRQLRTELNDVEIPF